MANEIVITPEDLLEAGKQTGTFKPCPFCGESYPLTFTTFNSDTGIYGVRIHCKNDLGCGANMQYNSRDKDEARRGVTRRWNQRA